MSRNSRLSRSWSAASSHSSIAIQATFSSTDADSNVEPGRKKRNKASRNQMMERDCRTDPTSLFLRMNYQHWDLAISQLRDDPTEAKIWLVSKREDGVLKFRYLPLHLACVQFPEPPPREFFKQLIGAYPDAIKSMDHEGNLPIHIACGNEAMYIAKDVITMLARAYPESLGCKTRNKLTPMDIVFRSKSSSKNTLLHSLRRIQNASLVKNEETSFDDDFSVARTGAKPPSITGSAKYQFDDKSSKSDQREDNSACSQPRELKTSVNIENVDTIQKENLPPLSGKKLSKHKIVHHINLEDTSFSHLEENQKETKNLDKIAQQEADVAAYKAEINAMKTSLDSYRDTISRYENNDEGFTHDMVSSTQESEQVRKLTNDNRALQNEVKRLARSYEKSQREFDKVVNEYKRQKSEQVDEVNELTRKLKRHEDNMDCGSLSTLDTKSTFNQSQTCNEDLKKKLKTLEAENMALSQGKDREMKKDSVITNYEKEIEEHINAKKDLERQNKLFREQMEENYEFIESNKSKMLDLIRDNDALSKEVTRLQESQKVKDKEINADIAKILNHSDEKMEELRKTCKSLKLETSEFEKKEEILMAEIASLKQTLESQKKSIDEGTQGRETLEKSIVELNSREERLTKDNQMLEQDNNRMKDIICNLEESEMNLRSQVEFMSKNSEEVTMTNDNLKIDMDRLMNEYKDSSKLNLENEEVMEKLVKKSDELQNANIELQHTIDTLKKEIAGNVEQFGSCNAENIRLRETLKELTNLSQSHQDTFELELNSIKSENVSLTEELASLLQEYESCNQDLQFTINRFNEVKEECLSLNEEINESGSNQAQLAATVEKLQSSISALQLETNKLSCENQILQKTSEVNENQVVLLNAENEDLKYQIHSIDAEKMEDMKAEIFALNNRINVQIEELSGMKDTLGNVTEQNKHINEENSQLKDKILSYEHLKKELLENNADLERALDESNSNLKSCEDKIDVLTESATDNSNAAEALNVENIKLREEITSITENLSYEQQKLESIEKEHSDLMEAFENQNYQLTQQEAATEAIQNEHSELIEAFDKQTIQLSEKIEVLEEVNTNLQSEKNKFQSVFAEKESLVGELDASKAEIAFLQKLLSEEEKTSSQKVAELQEQLTREKDSLLEQNNATTKKLADLQEKLQIMQEQLQAGEQAKLEAKIVEMSTSIEAIQSENKMLKNEIIDLEKTCADKENSKITLSTDIYDLNTQLEKMKTKIETIQAEKESLLSDVHNWKDLESQVETSRAETVSLRKLLCEEEKLSSAKIADLWEKIKGQKWESMNEINSLKQNAADLQNKLDILQKEHEEMKEVVDGQAAELSKKEESMKDLCKSNENLLGENEKLHNENTNLRNECTEKDDSYASLRVKLGEHQTELEKSKMETISLQKLMSDKEQKSSAKIATLYENINRQKEKFTKEHNLCKQNLTDARNELQNQESSVTKIKVSLEELQIDKENLLIEKSNILHTLEKSELEVSELQKQLSEKEKASSGKIAGLQKQIDRLKEDLMKERNISKQDLDDMNKKLQSMQEQHSEMKKIIENQTNQLVQQEVSMTEMSSSIEILEIENDNLQNQISSIKSKKMEIDGQKVNSMKKKHIEEMSCMQECHENMKKTIENQTIQLSEQRVSMSEMSSSIETLQIENKGLQEENSTLKSKLLSEGENENSTNLRDNLQIMQERHEGMKKTIIRQSSQILHQEATMSELKNSIVTMQNEIEKLQAENTDLKTTNIDGELEKSKAEIVDLQERFQEKEKISSDKIANLSEQINEQKETIDSLSTQIQNLSSNDSSSTQKMEVVEKTQQIEENARQDASHPDHRKEIVRLEDIGFSDSFTDSDEGSGPMLWKSENKLLKNRIVSLRLEKEEHTKKMKVMQEERKILKKYNAALKDKLMTHKTILFKISSILTTQDSLQMREMLSGIKQLTEISSCDASSALVPRAIRMDVEPEHCNVIATEGRLSSIIEKRKIFVGKIELFIAHHNDTSPNNVDQPQDLSEMKESLKMVLLTADSLRKEIYLYENEDSSGNGDTIENQLFPVLSTLSSKSSEDEYDQQSAMDELSSCLELVMSKSGISPSSLSQSLSQSLSFQSDITDNRVDEIDDDKNSESSKRTSPNHKDRLVLLGIEVENLIKEKELLIRENSDLKDKEIDQDLSQRKLLSVYESRINLILEKMVEFMEENSDKTYYAVCIDENCNEILQNENLSLYNRILVNALENIIGSIESKMHLFVHARKELLSQNTLLSTELKLKERKILMLGKKDSEMDLTSIHSGSTDSIKLDGDKKSVTKKNEQESVQNAISTPEENRVANLSVSHEQCEACKSKDASNDEKLKRMADERKVLKDYNIALKQTFKTQKIVIQKLQKIILKDMTR